MEDQVLEFISSWVYDIRRVLERELEGLKDDLWSDDEEISNRAAGQAKEILDWLYPPPPLPSEADRLQKIEAALKDRNLTGAERLAAIRDAGSSTRRGRGRPRTETPRQAIRALTLHYATPMSWREIALEVRGCKHKRPNPERSCYACGDAIRDAAGRLEGFLQGIGYDPDFPRGKELDENSRAELLRLLRRTE